MNSEESAEARRWFDAFTTIKAQDLAQPLVEAQIPFKIHIVKDHDMKERLCLEVERLGLSAVIMGSRGFGASRRNSKGRLGSVKESSNRSRMTNGVVHPSLKLLSKDDTIPICKIWATKPAKPVANIDHVSIERAVSSSHSATKTTLPPLPPSPSRRFAADEPHKGADILVEALERESVTDVFATLEAPPWRSIRPCPAPSPLQTTSSDTSRERFLQPRVTPVPPVVLASASPPPDPVPPTSSVGLADAMLDSIPLVAITGQVPRRMIGTDAFQETPIVEEAFSLPPQGRPGPVLVDIPKDIQQQLAIPLWNSKIGLQGYLSRLPQPPKRHFLEQVLRLVAEARCRYFMGRLYQCQPGTPPLCGAHWDPGGKYPDGPWRLPLK
ncbi:hypothetical protein HPP92_000878 [Vanilla planifolia]|uniref:Uncharacterized protein n=2 Tax=Vanilla planifolia TaxID=51239 RepID=A0A835S341_VANPL|nr:hypothetical protein HPP92_000878 [Vanilla planifolia]